MAQIPSAIIFTVFTAIVILFQLGLAIGMPWGSASMGGKFPGKDPEYNAENERKYLQKIINENLHQLEQQRMEFLSKDFNTGNNWWERDKGLKMCML